MRLDPRARIEIQEQAQDAARRAQDATRQLMQRLQRFQFDYDRRADNNDDRDNDANAVARPAPAPTPAPSRVRAGSRISSAGGGVVTGPAFGYGFVTGNGVASNAVAFAPAARAIATSGDGVFAVPAAGWGNVAVFNGDDATFTLQGLRLARVNDDLAQNLGRGSERGFLILDAGDRWDGLRAGDVLLEVDGRPVRDGKAARISLGSSDDHTAQVIREGHQRVVSVDMR